jgi:phage recombination protein Bet
MNATSLQAPKQPADLVRFTPYGGAEEIKLSVSIVQSLIAVPTKQGKLCSQRDALRFIAMCQARKLNPFEGDAFLIGYDGKDGPQFSLITAHQAFLKRAELHPEFDGMESGIVVVDTSADETPSDPVDIQGDFHTPRQTVVGGWAKVFFKNRKVPIYRRVRLARFQKPFGVWQDDPAGMICKVAEADALRSSFPTMLGGLYLRDEVEINVTPSSQTANASALVAVMPREPEDDNVPMGDEPPPPRQAAAMDEPPAKEAPQVTLAAVVEQAGHDFGTFAKWALAAGTIKDADSLTQWSDISTEDAERMLRGLRGAKTRATTLEQMAKVKGGLI